MDNKQGSRARLADIIIWTEGKTDSKHLEKAHSKLGLDLKIHYQQVEGKGTGNQELLRRCQTFSESFQDIPMIFIFDNDDESLIRHVSDNALAYKNWGNNVFSFPIPIPSHRKDHKNLCIEFYYTDEEITTKDNKGRRLFLTSEFSEITGCCLHDPKIHIGNLNKLRGVTEGTKAKVIDSEVFMENRNIALPKSDFADYIYKDSPPFNNFGFAEFRRIFYLVDKIYQVAHAPYNVCFPDLAEYLNSIKSEKQDPEQYVSLFASLSYFFTMMLQLFIVTVIRSYEWTFIDPAKGYYKKTKQIRKTLSERYRNPSLATLLELARQCNYLIDDTACDTVQEMRSCLGNDITISPVLEARFSTLSASASGFCVG